MNNQEIINNAPEGATHVENNGYYLMACSNGFMEPESSGVDWDYGYASHCEVRSLADIKRIVELEAYLQKVQADRINDIAIERKRWAKADLVALEIRDLEQQAKGCDNGSKACSISFGVDAVVIGETELNNYANELRNQAKALKEPKT
jgi:hypothetical protein